MKKGKRRNVAACKKCGEMLPTWITSDTCPKCVGLTYSGREKDCMNCWETLKPEEVNRGWCAKCDRASKNAAAIAGLIVEREIGKLAQEHKESQEEKNFRQEKLEPVGYMIYERTSSGKKFEPALSHFQWHIFPNLVDTREALGEYLKDADLIQDKSGPGDYIIVVIYRSKLSREIYIDPDISEEELEKNKAA